MRHVHTITLALLFLIACVHCTDPNTTGTEAVILLHGLGRTNRSLNTMEKALKESGYLVVNLTYPSLTEPIETLAVHLDKGFKQCCLSKDMKIHFVTHSMGGILPRYYLSDHHIENLGRVVMLSPPNKGSELADFVDKISRYTPPALKQLGTGKESIPLKLGPVDFELGIITGDRSFNPVASRIIPGDDDGTVSVEGAKVPGMSDFLVVDHTHTFIMNSPDVIDQTRAFLKNGRFKRE